MQRAPLIVLFISTPALAQVGPASAPEAEPAITSLEAEPTVAERATTGYDKGFYIASPDGMFKLVLGARIQGRFEFESADPGGGADRETEDAFSIPRARLAAKGHAFTEDIEYKFQADFGRGAATLKDFYFDYTLGTPRIRAGQFKRPFSRQQITSSGSQELVDRAITDKAFGAGRDIGVMIHNDFEASPEIEWAVGVFNGTGDAGVFIGVADPMTGEVTGSISNVPAKLQPAFVGRFGINQGGVKGYSEADLEGGPLRFGVAGSVLAALDNDGDDASGIVGELDAVAKVNGITAQTGVYVASAQDGTSFSDQSYGAFGLHLQAGYLLANNMQPVLRYAIVAPDGVTAAHEVTAGLSIYKFKHGLKWQTDVSLLGTSDGIADVVRARTQLQLAF